MPAAISGDFGKGFSGSSASASGSRHAPRTGSGQKRAGPGWDDTATIVRDKGLDRPIVGNDTENSRRGVYTERGLRREFSETRSEPAINSRQVVQSWEAFGCYKRHVPGSHAPDRVLISRVLRRTEVRGCGKVMVGCLHPAGVLLWRAVLCSRKRFFFSFSGP